MTVRRRCVVLRAMIDPQREDDEVKSVPALAADRL
jgi:hypothetical protein